MDLEPICLGGLPVLPLTRWGWAEHVLACARKQKSLGQPPAFFTDVNGNVISLAMRNTDFRSWLLTASGMNADGQSLVLMSKFLTRRLPGRASGADMIHDVAVLAAQTGASIFLLGGKESVNAGAADRLKTLYHDLQICGRRNGYFRADEEGSVVDEICSAKPDILFVALGVPKEQEFVARNRKKLIGVGAIKTAGGTFDVLVGIVPRPPKWMQEMGLEWLYRLMRDPRDRRRLFWRYASTNPHALFLLMTRSHARWLR